MADLSSSSSINQPSGLRISNRRARTPPASRAPGRDKRWQLPDSDLLYFPLVIASNQLFRGYFAHDDTDVVSSGCRCNDVQPQPRRSNASADTPADSRARDQTADGGCGSY